MPIREVYVGALGRNMQLDWGGDFDGGNVPARLSPLFPIAGSRVHPYMLVLNWINCGRIQGRQVDWGAHAAIITIGDLNDILLAIYGAERIPVDLTAFASSLTPVRQYAIVASTSEEIAGDRDPSPIVIKSPSGEQDGDLALQRLQQPVLLCVSDDQTTLMLLKQMCSGRMEIVTTSDQIEALNLIRFTNPAAVIFDMAPEHFMAGTEALSTQCRVQNVKLIVVAPNAQAATIAKAMSPAVQCVVKPMSIEKLASQTTLRFNWRDDNRREIRPTVVIPTSEPRKLK